MHGIIKRVCIEYFEIATDLSAVQKVQHHG